MGDALPLTNDTFGRPLRDLRLSVTDRCNFRCTYCMPKEVFGASYRFLPRTEILSFEELERITRLFVALGVEKVRITGGEPLVRQELEDLIGRISAIPGVRDIAMTTNGSLLTPRKASALKAAGLRRVTVSLDSLDDAVFQAMNDVRFPAQRVLDAIDVAKETGFSPVKVNMVVKRGVNDASVVAMAEHFRGSGVIVRFIEYMDVGNSNGWRMEDVMPGREIVGAISKHWPLEPLSPTRPGEVAKRYRYADGAGEVGIITSVSQPFCHGCTRARLSAEGLLYTCLFGTHGHDLRALLRSGAPDDEILSHLREIWHVRADRYSELRTAATPSGPKVEMSHIGG